MRISYRNSRSFHHREIAANPSPTTTRSFSVLFFSHTHTHDTICFRKIWVSSSWKKKKEGPCCAGWGGSSTRAGQVGPKKKKKKKRDNGRLLPSFVFLYFFFTLSSPSQQTIKHLLFFFPQLPRDFCVCVRTKTQLVQVRARSCESSGPAPPRERTDHPLPPSEKLFTRQDSLPLLGFPGDFRCRQ